MGYGMGRRLLSTGSYSGIIRLRQALMGQYRELIKIVILVKGGELLAWCFCGVFFG